MRLIDADALKNLICNDCPARIRCEDSIISGSCSDIDRIDNMPTVDAKPVKHGEWITSQLGKPTKEWKCTACQGLIMLPVFVNNCYYDYCPNCGARMDLKEGDTSWQ